MSELGFASKALSFFCGIGLGVLDYRLFERSLVSLLDEGEKKPIRKLAVRAGIFRHVFIFLAGISLIRVASLPPVPLCGGLLVAVLGYRIYLLGRDNRGKREGGE